MKSLVNALTQWSILLTIRLPLTLLGIVIVPIALLFKVEGLKMSLPFTKYNTLKYWWHVGLPKWAWLWGNDRDGAKGDKRGWWDFHGVVSGGSENFFNQFWWLAIRNPVNNMRWVPFLSVNMNKAFVEKLGGQNIVSDKDDGSELGWQFLKATGSKFSYYRFQYLSKPYLDDRIFVFMIGHKIKLSHNDKSTLGNKQKAWKGFTFRINPFLKYKE